MFVISAAASLASIWERTAGFARSAVGDGFDDVDIVIRTRAEHVGQNLYHIASKLRNIAERLTITL